MMFTHKTMKQYRETAGIAALAIGLAACAGSPALSAPDTAPTANLVEAVTYEYPFRDPSLSPEARAADLVSRLTLEEKAAQMYDKAAPVERLGIRKHNWWNEALHGVARAGEATVFPQAIGLAATWDEDLMLDVATAISDVLVDADLTLSRGSLVGLYFVSAKARRVQDSDVRRIDLKFRARVEDN